MDEYKVLIFPSAVRDLQDIIDYLNELAPAAALELYDDMIARINNLETFPLRFPLAKNIQLRAKGYRVLRVHQYLVFYVVKDKTVEIRRILYGRRHYETLL